MKITITGVDPYDGEYWLGDSFDDWTNREWAILKRVSGIKPLGLEDALREHDVTVFTAAAIVGLRRSGRFARIDEDRLWDTAATCYTLDLRDADEVEADEEPADPSPPSGPETPGQHSGSPSPTDMGSLVDMPRPSGTPSSGTPTYDQRISGT